MDPVDGLPELKFIIILCDNDVTLLVTGKASVVDHLIESFRCNLLLLFHLVDLLPSD